MTSHRGRRHIPVPMLAAGAVAVVVSLGGIAGVEAARHDPVRVIPVGSISPLPTPAVSPLTGVAPVSVCWAGGPSVIGSCVTQDPRAVVDGSAVTR